jgi:hypothetical protein
MFELGQPQISVCITDYKVRIVVQGSRGYSDRKEFHCVMSQYVKQFNEPILFISGAAWSGADRLIIQWCQKFKYPCKQMPADWDTYQKRAGFLRNIEMAKVATHLVSFYDGKSPGTKHQLSVAKDYNLIVTAIIINKEDTNV